MSGGGSTRSSTRDFVKERLRMIFFEISDNFSRSVRRRGPKDSEFRKSEAKEDKFSVSFSTRDFSTGIVIEFETKRLIFTPLDKEDRDIIVSTHSTCLRVESTRGEGLEEVSDRFSLDNDMGRDDIVTDFEGTGDKGNVTLIEGEREGCTEFTNVNDNSSRVMIMGEVSGIKDIPEEGVRSAMLSGAVKAIVNRNR